jgi:hypothetical protein
MRYGGKFHLTAITREYFPFFCVSFGDKIRYKNIKNQILEFEVVEIKYFEDYILLNREISCPDSSGLFQFDCIDIDKLLLRLESDSVNFEITLSTELEYYHQELGDVYDMFIISRYLKPYNPDFLMCDFAAITDQRDISFGRYPCRKLYETIELNGKEFHNIIGYDDAYPCPGPAYFINPGRGLVAFTINDNESLWVIEE